MLMVSGFSHNESSTSLCSTNISASSREIAIGFRDICMPFRAGRKVCRWLCSRSVKVPIMDVNNRHSPFDSQHSRRSASRYRMRAPFEFNSHCRLDGLVGSVSHIPGLICNIPASDNGTPAYTSNGLILPTYPRDSKFLTKH